MSTLSIASVLLVILLLLLAGGVWIAIALAASAWFGLQFFTSTPPDVNLFQSFWASSVLAMLTVTGIHDHVPILPEVWVEWREVIEYSASILLAFVSGNLLGVLIFLVAVVDEIFSVARGEKPSYQIADEERRARGDFSETV